MEMDEVCQVEVDKADVVELLVEMAQVRILAVIAAQKNNLINNNHLCDINVM